MTLGWILSIASVVRFSFGGRGSAAGGGVGSPGLSKHSSGPSPVFNSFNNLAHFADQIFFEILPIFLIKKFFNDTNLFFIVIG